MTLEEQQQLASFRVITGDCMEIMQGFEDRSFDAVITSPPFRDADVAGGDYYSWFVNFVRECIRVSHDYAMIFNSSTRMVEICRRTDPFTHVIWNKMAGRTPYRHEIIFIYKNPKARYNIRSRDSHHGGSHIWTDCIPCQPLRRFPRGRSVDLNTNKNRISANSIFEDRCAYENPPKLIEYLIRFLDPRYRTSILDPCCGSGTTLAAGLKFGMKVTGIEIVPAYARHAENRLKEIVGQERLL
jgi:DNA modification methylase